jgi:hypothetical protein|tara:strand:- start:264 stop:1088 length:825 start_codon:yes stop_codon:yes gene_type:complete
MATETVSQVTRAAPFIEAAGKTFIDDLQKAVGGFKAADLTKVFGPQFVAGQGALTQDAISKAAGLGSFQPFLQTASALAPTSGAQLQSLISGFKSPFQQDVIDATLREFDVQAAKGLPSIAAQAVSKGVLGGGREGVQRAEYQAASDRNRAALLAQLNQSGFADAQRSLQQALTNQLGLARTAPSLAGQEITGLTTLGGLQQAQDQATLSAQQQLLQKQLDQPITAAQTLGSGVASLIAGYPGQTQQSQVVVPSLAQTALGAGATLAGIYRAFS